MRGQGVDLGPGGFEDPAALGGEPGRLVGVERDAGEDPGRALGDLDRPAGAGQVTADLDDALHPDGARSREGVVDAEAVGLALPSRVPEVEVAVAVVDRDREGGRRRRIARHAPSSSRASSSSTTEGSSLVNTGVGVSSAVPGRMGTPAPRGRSE